MQIKSFFLLLFFICIGISRCDKATCENITMPATEEQCINDTTKDCNTSSGKCCCQVTFKANGRRYSMCSYYESGKFKDFKKNFTEYYSSVKIHCSMFYQKIGIISLVALIAIVF